ncbi:MAG: hypothetical protein NZ533_09175 [Casimicrobiaceae bacterium]|nr:hypothetical protein [Casimicrobiaceae bacterium]MDW8312198.1 hypothetical protein [Burkholderiales bacterium]
MRRGWLWGLLAIALAAVLILGVLLWRLPASFALAWLPASLDAYVRIHRAEGTIWNGRATFSSPWLTATHALAWRCAPSWRLAIDCELDELVQGRLSLRAPRQVEGQLLRSSLGLQAPLGAGVRVTLDRVDFEIEQLKLTHEHLAIAGTATARGVVFATRPGLSMPIRSIDRISAECRPEERATRCQLQSFGTGATLAGEIELAPTQTRGRLELNVPSLGREPLVWSLGR